MNTISKKTLNEIFEIEANCILQKIQMIPSLLPYFINFNDTKRERAIVHIMNLLKVRYTDGVINVSVKIDDENQQLQSHALWFIPDKHKGIYLHKIYVHEEYRGKGVGTDILNAMHEKHGNVSLLCPADKTEFYKKNGFKVLSAFKTPSDKNLQLISELYNGLLVMTNSKQPVPAPIYLLDDNDLKKVSGPNQQ